MFCISYDILLLSDVCTRKKKHKHTHTHPHTQKAKEKEKKKNFVPVEKIKNKTINNKKAKIGLKSTHAPQPKINKID